MKTVNDIGHEVTQKPKVFLSVGIAILISACSLSKIASYQQATIELSQRELIQTAYQEDSIHLLRKFFRTWEHDTIPVDTSDVPLPEVVRHAYEVFADFYQPKNLAGIGNPERSSDQFQHVDYFLVQGSLHIHVVEHLTGGGAFGLDFDPVESLVLDDFSPPTSADVAHLRLDDHYRRLLTEFLNGGTASPPSGMNSYPLSNQGDSTNRQAFLNQIIQVYRGHWSGWNLITDPTVTLIAFDADFQRAKVYFALVDQGGEALYQNGDSGWFLVASRLTWIT